jgi:crossover junction endodeoxyribonuclease RuvC
MGGARRIIGVDPGSVRTGYGIVDLKGNVVTAVAWGVIRLDEGDSFPDRLLKIHSELSRMILLHKPAEAAVEKVFLAKNAMSALKLGQARGAAIVTAAPTAFPSSNTARRRSSWPRRAMAPPPRSRWPAWSRACWGCTARPPDASDALAMAFCRAVTREYPEKPG